MATIEGKIADLLLGRLASLPGLAASAISYPGLPFKPPPGAYVDASLLPNTTVTRSVSLAGANQYQGFLQVAVMHPIGVGAIPAMDLAGKVIEHYSRGTVLTGGGITVRIIRQPWVSPPMQDADRLRVPVSIPFICFASAI